MEEESQAIVWVVEGALEGQIGERGVVDVKGEEKFKKEDTLRVKKYKEVKSPVPYMSTEKIPAHPTSKTCPALSESQHDPLPLRPEARSQGIQLCLGDEEMESENLHDSFKSCKGKGDNKLLYAEDRAEGRFLCLVLTHVFSIGEIFPYEPKRNSKPTGRCWNLRKKTST